jgi:tetratricopeptide (TPR) repeat protein
MTGRVVVWTTLVATAVFTGCGSGNQNTGGGSVLQQIADAKGIQDPEIRARKLLAIADQQLRVQDSSGAQEALSAADTACQQVASPARQSRLLAQLAYNYAKCKSDSAARRALSSARSALDKIKLEKASDYRNKVYALTGLAQAYHALRDTNGAVGALRSAEEVSAQAKSGEPESLRRLQAESLNSVASIYQAIEKPEHAQRAINQALELAKGLTKPDDRADLLASIAVTQVGLKMKEADETFDLAEKAAGEITELHLQATALVSIAGKLDRSGREEKAAAVLDHAEQVTEKVKDRTFREGLEKEIRAARGN